MGQPRTVDPKRKHGQVGETWGNLLMEEGALEFDDEIVFEGDEKATRYFVTRVNVYPLDVAKRLFYYQAHPRKMDSTMERPHTPTVQ